MFRALFRGGEGGVRSLRGPGEYGIELRSSRPARISIAPIPQLRAWTR